VGVADCMREASPGASTRAVHPASEVTAFVFGDVRGGAPGERVVIALSAVQRPVLPGSA
jgi:hypothetical protein